MGLCILETPTLFLLYDVDSLKLSTRETRTQTQ